MTLVYENINEAQILFLREQGFVFVDTRNEYEAQRLQKNKLICVWYTSGKLVIQGNDNELEELANLLKRHNLKPNKNKQKVIEERNYDFNSKKHVGSDETLKGDTFGGLVVCAFLYEPKIKEDLISLGVKDSKQLSDKKIEEIAQSLLKKYKNRISLLELKPKEYNEKTKTISITKILNDSHSKLAKKLDSSCEHIVDKYPGCNSGTKQITKGEEHSLAIATASIVARYTGLKQFSYLSSLAGFTLPKGSTHVKAALEKLVDAGKDLSQFAKLHFQNVRRVLENAKQTF